MVHFRHIFVHCMLFQSHLNFCANLFGNLNENSPYATHHHISNFRMTIVENYLLRYFDHHPQYYTQFAPLRDRNQPRLKSMSKVCNVSSQMSQRKKIVKILPSIWYTPNRSHDTPNIVKIVC